MEYAIIFIVAIVALVLGAVGGFLFARMRTVAAETLLSNQQAESERLKAEVAESREQNVQLRAENARLGEQLRQQSEEQKNLRRDSELVFREIATAIFDEKSKVMRESSRDQLGEILTPFKSDLESLKKTIHDCYTGEVSEVKSLRDSVKELTELNTTIGREAKELSVALRSNGKRQGDWGELMLKQILEKSGLEEGVNYVLQATEDEQGNKIKNETGGQLRPDALFYLPDGKCIVIDSKVSLTAYVDYVNAPAEEQKAALDAHLKSVRDHIAELAAKEYHRHIEGSADFVMMFMPNEGAYLAALNADRALWESAYHRQVVLISPTHLISVLKLMYQLWTRDKQTKNAMKIAEDTGRLYDKLVGFVTDLENIGINLDRAAVAYEDAYKKFSTGRGNILSKVENIRELGVKTAKKLQAGEE
ncbi:MAG: DNA recombination protein RmuC [Alistipes sp.]|jgi:DNA recombination protein RmuC|nr:DNA recombination protein RmuC [Alistipes sp.]